MALTASLFTYLLIIYMYCFVGFDYLLNQFNRRPTTLHDRGRDSDDDDYQDRDYDVAALANNLSQAFRYGIYENDDNDEVYQKLAMFLCSFLFNFIFFFNFRQNSELCL